MSEIIVNVDTPEEAFVYVRAILQNGFMARKFTVNFDLANGIRGKIKNKKDFPLCLEGFSAGGEMNVYVSAVAAGGRFGNYSNAMYRILRIAGFPVEAEEISSIRHVKNGICHLTVTLV